MYGTEMWEPMSWTYWALLNSSLLSPGLMPPPLIITAPRLYHVVCLVLLVCILVSAGVLTTVPFGLYLGCCIWCSLPLGLASYHGKIVVS